MGRRIRIAGAFPPGAFLEEELEARGWSQPHLAAMLGWPLQSVTEIIQGHKSITPGDSAALGSVLGVSPDFFEKLERIFQDLRSVR